MIPTFDQISDAAYYRWQRRGYNHGHDRSDWLAAEQELLFAGNYEVVLYEPLDGEARSLVGSPRRRVCRFCERSAPAATFSDARPALPTFLGNRSLWTYEECDDCHEEFSAGIDADLAAFLARVREGSGGGRPAPGISVAALKGLVRTALAVLPGDELHSFEDTIEWVGNPDHEFDVRLFGEVGCDLHVLPAPLAHPWIALARRIDEEAPVPYLLVFVGTGSLVLEAPVPLCIRDEDLDGEPVLVPQTCAALTPGLEPAWGAIVPLAGAGW
jgi:hypothetical protein